MSKDERIEQLSQQVASLTEMVESLSETIAAQASLNKQINQTIQECLTGITEKSLNAFYYVCSYAKVDGSSFLTTTARIALGLIPSFLDAYPVFFCVDDTMVPKAGKKFEQVSILFDHAAHDGNSYLNGHCFVSVMLCIPYADDKNSDIHYGNCQDLLIR